MNYLETTLEAERLALLQGENRGDVISWLTSPLIGYIPTDWDDE